MRAELDEALRRGDVAGALTSSRRWADGMMAQGTPADQIGIEIARAVAATYRDLVTEPIHQYQSQAARALPEGVGALVERALKRLVDVTLFWEQQIEMVYRERLARELRDFTRARNYEGAAENIRLLCGGARSPEDSLRLAQYCGTILGTCENHPRDVEAVMARLDKDPVAHGLTHQLVNELRAARQKRLDIVMRSHMETREVEWLRTLTATVVEVQRQMPPKERMDEPDEAVLRDLGDLMRSFARIPLWRNQPAKFIDATLLLVELVPKELAVAAAQSGIEGRVYMSLGFTAKKAVLLTFGDLGKLGAFTEAYEQFTRNVASQTPYHKFFVEVMGATRSLAFYNYLVERYSDKKLVELQDEIVDALGNIGNADARNLLLKHLEDTLTARVIDPPRVRKASRVIASLASSRSPRLTPAERSDLIRRALHVLPRDQVRMALQAALQFFSYNPDPLPRELREWAVETLSQALWLQDDSPDWAQGAERQNSFLGFRQPMTETLKRLVPDAPDPFLRRIERQALRYSGAYMAVAEICEKTKLERALPVLETMLRNTLTFDDTDVNRYEAETYWDASSQQRVSLGKDKVVAPLVYAIGTIGGAEAFRILADLDDQVREARVAMPGPETARFLMEFLQKLGPEFGGEAGAMGGGPGSAAGPSELLDPRRLDELVKVLRSSFLLVGSGKRRLKISAISELGQYASREAIPPLIEQLIDKDDMVQGAARTALLEYMGRRVPQPTRNEFLQQIVGVIESPDPALRQGAIQTVRAVGPGRPEVRSLLELALKASTSTTVQKQIQLLLQEGGVGHHPAGSPDPASSGGGAGAAAGAVPGPGEPPSSGAGPGPAAPGRQPSALDLKRQYVIARQEWIRGGKKGPPPEPPPGA